MPDDSEAFLVRGSGTSPAEEWSAVRGRNFRPFYDRGANPDAAFTAIAKNEG